MGFIKRTNKKFDYKPRYYQGEGNPYEVKHKFDEFRTTTGKNKNLKAKLITAWDELKESRGRGINKTIVLIVVLLSFFFLLFIDFDLSIFIK